MKHFRLRASALLFAFSAILISCAESTAPLAPPAEPAAELAPQSEAELLGLLSPTLGRLGFMSCRPLPRAEASAVIGRDGGVIQVGPHRLVVPRGALSRPTRITAVAPTGNINHVEFAPHGLRFREPVRLTMSYANCGLVGRLIPGHIAYTTDDLRVLELLDAVPNLLRKETTAELDHFSDYVIAW